GVRQRQHGIAEVAIKNALAHVKDERRRDSAIKARIGLRGKSAEWHYEAAGVDAAFHATRTNVEELGDVDADGGFHQIDPIEIRLLLHAMAGNTHGHAGADELALPIPANPRKRAKAGVLQFVLAAAP